MASLERASLEKRRGRLLREVSGTVLEIGPGTGANLPHFSNSRVFGVEPDLAMVERFREKFGQSSNGSRVVLGRAEAVPLLPESVDFVVSSLVLCSVHDLTAALREIHRVLRPGGTFVFLEHVRGEGARGLLQDLIQPIWSSLACNCHPNRRTLENLQENGFSIEQSEFFNPFQSFPLMLRPFLRFFLPFAEGKAVKK